MEERAEPGGSPEPGPVGDVQGAGRLLGAAVLGVTGVVEEMHAAIATLAPIVGPPRPGRTRGITRLVYRSIRGVTTTVSAGIEVATPMVAPLLDRDPRASVRRDALVAVLNGVHGDYLAATANPLAIPMRIRRDGRAIALHQRSLRMDVPHASPRIMVFVHGLCMNDRHWNRGGWDHGAALARELGYTPLHVHYNTGRRVSVNGRELAGTMERLVREWPVTASEVVIVGHSMGGLVARSACHYAAAAGHEWHARLRNFVFLGTPHHGAALERAGNGLARFLELSPYSAPIARIGAVRSAGIQDLRHGNLLDEDWQRRGASHAHDARTPVPLPDGVACFAIAACRQANTGQEASSRGGDGLVSVRSALGLHEDAGRALRIPDRRRHVQYGINHFELLESPAVFSRIREWLNAQPGSSAATA
jgi:pimeloyl-ACP methyl ester carboxylesterase